MMKNIIYYNLIQNKPNVLKLNFYHRYLTQLLTNPINVFILIKYLPIPILWKEIIYHLHSLHVGTTC